MSLAPGYIADLLTPHVATQGFYLDLGTIILLWVVGSTLGGMTLVGKEWESGEWESGGSSGIHLSRKINE